MRRSLQEWYRPLGAHWRGDRRAEKNNPRQFEPEAQTTGSIDSGLSQLRGGLQEGGVADCIGEAVSFTPMACRSLSMVS
jgi:hypothetical protein